MKPGRGIVAQQKALTFETPFFDEAQGIIARILALLTDTILFSRRVIDIQNVLLNMTSPSTKKTKDNSKDGQTLSTEPRGVATAVSMRLNVFNVTVLMVSR